MKIIGIDVGTNNLAISVFIDGKLDSYKILQNKKSTSTGQKLREIQGFLHGIFEEEKPDCIVAEGTFFMASQARGYAHVSKAIGVIELTAWDVLNKGIEILQPTTVKKAVTGSGRAKKEQVAEAIKEKFNLTGDFPDHVTDAIAIGFSYIQKQKEVM